MSATNSVHLPSNSHSATAAVNADGETADQALIRAREAVRAKRLHEASGICADILAASPDHPAALALQGIITGMAGNPDAAIVLLRKAIGLRPVKQVGMRISAPSAGPRIGWTKPWRLPGNPSGWIRTTLSTWSISH